MGKSTTQINFEKAKMAVRIIAEHVSNTDNIQVYIVKEFFRAYHNDEIDLAYQIVNEAFNNSLIAGYKYLECCKICKVKGEFYEMAISNPLVNL